MQLNIKSTREVSATFIFEIKFLRILFKVPREFLILFVLNTLYFYIEYHELINKYISKHIYCCDILYSQREALQGIIGVVKTETVHEQVTLFGTETKRQRIFKATRFHGNVESLTSFCLY